MTSNGHAKDPQIEAAIAATEQVQPMRQWAAKIASTGRQAVILLPADATDGEIAEFCGWVLSAVMATYRAERAQPKSGILLPQPGHIVRA